MACIDSVELLSNTKRPFRSEKQQLFTDGACAKQHFSQEDEISWIDSGYVCYIPMKMKNKVRSKFVT